MLHSAYETKIYPKISRFLKFKTAILVNSLVKKLHSSMLKSTGSLHFNLHARLPLLRRLKCGRLYDLVS